MEYCNRREGYQYHEFDAYACIKCSCMQISSHKDGMEMIQLLLHVTSCDVQDWTAA
ncbi:hypothetical protein L798_07064 [Zootermopsis nevadensis]|uniref:Uncharacterized protein n=1 Tax=Zootermopsis nevadensis TaxID=136037 RepID=A0A067RF97_ZOONE|nr:hypothetical protein L798_07064 [Zootermopsis nevadensis]